MEKRKTRSLPSFFKGLKEKRKKKEEKRPTRDLSFAKE